MKLLHLGDLHIGKSVNDYHMIEDQEYILEQILSIVEEREIDAVLIAGDVYDKTIPSEEAVRVLDHFLCRLAQMQRKTYLISGNHDSEERLHFGSALFEARGIYIASKYEGTLYRQTLEDAYGEIHFYLLPFVKASQVKHFFPEEKIDSYEQAVSVILRHAGIRETERNILVAHQFVTGGKEEPVFGGSENMTVRHVGNVEKIRADVLEGFDYVALGHLHAPQKVGKETIRYAGSPLKYSFSEIQNEKSVPVVTIREKGTVEIELVPLRPLRDMRHLKGRMEQLLDPKNVQDPEDFIYVTLTEETPVLDAMTILRQYYPRTLKLDYENSHTQANVQPDLAEEMQEKSFQELISAFYEMMYGCAIDEEELRVALEAAGEAGVAGEAG